MIHHKGDDEEDTKIMEKELNLYGEGAGIQSKTYRVRGTTKRVTFATAAAKQPLEQFGGSAGTSSPLLHSPIVW